MLFSGGRTGPWESPSPSPPRVGVASCSKASVLPRNKWIPQPPPPHPPLRGPPTLEGRNSEKMRCHVRRCACGRVCANCSNTWGPRIRASALRSGGSVGLCVGLFIVTRLAGEVCPYSRFFQTFDQGSLYSIRALGCVQGSAGRRTRAPGPWVRQPLLPAWTSRATWLCSVPPEDLCNPRVALSVEAWGP